MRTSYRALAAALIIGGVPGVSSAAAVFDFSYTFRTSSHTVNGSISGTRNDNGTSADLTDDFVQGVSVLSAFYDGAAFDGPVLTLSAYDQYSWAVGPATMAFAATRNNFILVNCDGPSTCLAGNTDNSVNINYFMLRTPGQGGTAAAFTSESGSNVFEDPVNVSGWSLSEHAVNAAPEPSTYALLGLGLASLGWMRRRRQA